MPVDTPVSTTVGAFGGIESLFALRLEIGLYVTAAAGLHAHSSTDFQQRSSLETSTSNVGTRPSDPSSALHDSMEFRLLFKPSASRSLK